MGNRRLASRFAFGAASEIGVYRDFFSGRSQVCPMHAHAGGRRARHAATEQRLCVTESSMGRLP